MNDPVIVLTPLLVLLILALFRFTGCKPFSTTPTADPPPAGPPPGGPPAAPLTYAQIVAATLGFTAHWRLNETSGNVATVLGPLNPGANGVYKTGPAGAGLTLGQPGALSQKDSKDFAPELDGTAAYVEVPFNAPLNPGGTLQFSVELWVKPNPALGPNNQIVISSHKGDATNGLGYEIALIKKNNEPHQQVRARVFSNALPTPSEVTVQPNQGDPAEWRHIVWTYAGKPGAPGDMKLYVRIAKSSGPFQGGPGAAAYVNVSPTNPVPLRFGAGHQQQGGPGNFFAGRIDEVAFYNVVLPQADIDKHFQAF
jgi:Concanavalin A-like lectin/glucanases superfamily